MSWRGFYLLSLSALFFVTMDWVFLFPLYSGTPLSTSLLAQAGSAVQTSAGSKVANAYCKSQVGRVSDITAVRCSDKEVNGETVRGYCTQDGSCRVWWICDKKEVCRVIPEVKEGQTPPAEDPGKTTFLESPVAPSGASTPLPDGDDINCTLGGTCASAPTQQQAPSGRTNTGTFVGVDTDNAGADRAETGVLAPLTLPDVRSAVGLPSLELQPINTSEPTGAPMKADQVVSDSTFIQDGGQEPSSQTLKLAPSSETVPTGPPIDLETAKKNLDAAQQYQKAVFDASANVSFDPADPAFQRASAMKEDAARRVIEAAWNVHAVQNGSYAFVGLAPSEGPRPAIESAEEQQRALFNVFAKEVPSSITIGQFASQLEASDKVVLSGVSQGLINMGIETPQLVQQNLQRYIETGDFPGLEQALAQGARGEGGLAAGLRQNAEFATERAAAYAEALPRSIESWRDFGTTVGSGVGWLGETALAGFSNAGANLLGGTGISILNPDSETALSNAVNPNRAAAQTILDAAIVMPFAYMPAKSFVGFTVDAAANSVREGFAIAARDVSETVGREAYITMSDIAVTESNMLKSPFLTFERNTVTGMYGLPAEGRLVMPPSSADEFAFTASLQRAAGEPVDIVSITGKNSPIASGGEGTIYPVRISPIGDPEGASNPAMLKVFGDNVSPQEISRQQVVYNALRDGEIPVPDMFLTDPTRKVAIVSDLNTKAGEIVNEGAAVTAVSCNNGCELLAKTSLGSVPTNLGPTATDMMRAAISAGQQGIEIPYDAYMLRLYDGTSPAISDFVVGDVGTVKDYGPTLGFLRGSVEYNKEEVAQFWQKFGNTWGANTEISSAIGNDGALAGSGVYDAWNGSTSFLDRFATGVGWKPAETPSAIQPSSLPEPLIESVPWPTSPVNPIEPYINTPAVVGDIKIYDVPGQYPTIVLDSGARIPTYGEPGPWLDKVQEVVTTDSAYKALIERYYGENATIIQTSDATFVRSAGGRISEVNTETYNALQEIGNTINNQPPLPSVVPDVTSPQPPRGLFGTLRDWRDRVIFNVNEGIHYIDNKSGGLFGLIYQYF